jgi:hypothetical protein
MLWSHYIFRQGAGVHQLWDEVMLERPVNLLYISARGFDRRANVVLDRFIDNCLSSQVEFTGANLLLMGFPDYQLSDDLIEETQINSAAMETSFLRLNASVISRVDVSTKNHEDSTEDDEVSASAALRASVEAVVNAISNQTDVILDISSLPRVAYLGILTGLLERTIADKESNDALFASGINLYVLVGEDAALDAHIRAEDPSSEITLVPGFAGALHSESVRDWPLVWFPLLGEGRINQLQGVMNAYVTELAEVCPVLPHPSRDPKRADRLLIEYKVPLFDQRQTPTSNIMYVHEAQPFEAYRQLLKTMRRYKESLRTLGGCNLVVTPLSSKLMTVGATLACYEMKPLGSAADYGVAIPYAEVTRYTADVTRLRTTKPVMSCLLLTGRAYQPS